jgi:hypothetical protein
MPILQQHLEAKPWKTFDQFMTVMITTFFPKTLFVGSPNHPVWRIDSALKVIRIRTES